MADSSGQGCVGKWPRRLVPQDSHYIVHRVARARIDGDALVLSCVNENGRPYFGGPLHATQFENLRRPISEYLGERGIARVEDIKYVVAYHSGGLPNGMVNRLMSSEEEVRALVARVIETRAYLAKSDGEIGVIVSRWRRKKPPANGPTPRPSPGTSSPPTGQGLFGGWRVVDRTQEAVEKGVAYILTGQHLGRKPPETPSRVSAPADGKPTPKPGEFYEIEDGTDAVIITSAPGPDRAKNPKSSPMGDAESQSGE